MADRRLCMIVHGPYPIGQPPRVVREARAAMDAGFDVVIVATGRPGEADREIVDGIEVARVPIVHRRGVGLTQMLTEYVGFCFLASLLVLRLWRRRRFDVVHVHNPPDFLVFAALIPKLLGAKVILDFHDLAPDMFAMRFAKRTGSRAAIGALKVIQRMAARIADDVLTVHEPYRQELVRSGVPWDKVTIVMNTPDETVLARVRSSASNSGTRPHRIVYHGTVTPHYGLLLLTDAFRTVRDAVPTATLEILGEGDAVPDVLARAQQNGVDDAVYVSGEFLPHEDVLSRVTGADVGVIPNLPIGLNRFALSTKLFEYCALDIPTVVADLPTFRAHFSDSQVTFFTPGDADSLADALISLLRSPEVARSRAQEAKARMADYRWELSRERYVEILEGAV